MKRKKDPGLLYVQKLGISPAKTVEALMVSMHNKFGYERGREYWDNFPENGENKEFYEHKNSDEEISYLFTGGHDADIIRQCANWVDAHKEAFGNEILEVGCDIGFMTGFLALTFPESKITAIDHSQNSINMAGKLMDRLGVTNVELVCTELEDLDEELEFDTVVSMRCINENVTSDRHELYIPNYNMLNTELFEKYLPAIDDYLLQLYSHIKYGGTLVTLTNTGLTPVAFAWMYLMSRIRIKINKDSYRKLTCKTPLEGGIVLMQAFYAVCEPPIDDSGMQESESAEDQESGTDQPSEEYVQEFTETASWAARNMVAHPSGAVFHDWEAEIMRMSLAEDLVDGIAVVGPDGSPVARFCLYTDRIDPTAILAYSGNNGKMTLQVHDISGLEDGKAEYRKIRDLELHGLKDLINKEHCSMYPVIWEDGRETIDMEHKIH